jgi:hypothetical protein
MLDEKHILVNGTSLAIGAMLILVNPTTANVRRFAVGFKRFVG